MGHTAEALTFYKNYLRRKPDAANRDEVERRIQDLEKAEASQPAAAAPVPTADASQPAAGPAPVTAVPPASTTETSQAAPAGVDLSARSEPTPEPVRTPIFKTWWFWTGVGAVVAGGVVTTLLLTRSKDGVFCVDCNATSGVRTE